MVPGAAIRRALLVALSVLISAASAAGASAAQLIVPDPGAPTQVARTVSLQEGARLGLVDLRAKGLQYGDSVSIKVTHRPMRGPVDVRIRVEFHFAGAGTLSQGAIDGIKSVVEKRLNRGDPTTGAGDPVRFELEVRARGKGEQPTMGFHQIRLVDPLRDLRPPVPDFRDDSPLGVPNAPQDPAEAEGDWSIRSTRAWPHEALHLAGLADRYQDVYVAKGRVYPLPEDLDVNDRAVLAKWARSHKPPLAPPPAGRIDSRQRPGTGPCDIMGLGADSPCARVSKRDLDWLASRAGVKVETHPGDVLLNKDPSRQNMGISFSTIVFAPPGRSETADGISAYCISETRGRPQPGDGFDVLGPAAERPEPGMRELGLVLAELGRRQVDVDDVGVDAQLALWSVTDGFDLTGTFGLEPSIEILRAAGVTQGAATGFVQLASPNPAGTTTAVTPDGVVPSPPAPRAPRARPGQLVRAALFPARIVAGRPSRAELALAVTGEATRGRVVLQRRAGARWVATRRPVRRVLEPGETIMRLRLPALRPGRHRLVVTTGHGTLRVPVRVSRSAPRR